MKWYLWNHFEDYKIWGNHDNLKNILGNRASPVHNSKYSGNVRGVCLHSMKTGRGMESRSSAFGIQTGNHFSGPLWVHHHSSIMENRTVKPLAAGIASTCLILTTCQALLKFPVCINLFHPLWGSQVFTGEEIIIPVFIPVLHRWASGGTEWLKNTSNSHWHNDKRHSRNDCEKCLWPRVLSRS